MKDETDPIDAEMQKRLDTGKNMTGAVGWGEEQWNRAMNHAYQTALKNLTPKQRSLLQASQRSWVRFRDAEFALIQNFFDHAPSVTASSGNPARLDFGLSRVALVKSRAVQLRRYKANPFVEGEH